MYPCTPDGDLCPSPMVSDEIFWGLHPASSSLPEIQGSFGTIARESCRYAGLVAHWNKGNRQPMSFFTQPGHFYHSHPVKGLQFPVVHWNCGMEPGRGTVVYVILSLPILGHPVRRPQMASLAGFKVYSFSGVATQSAQLSGARRLTEDGQAAS